MFLDTTKVDVPVDNVRYQSSSSSQLTNLASGQRQKTPERKNPAPSEQFQRIFKNNGKIRIHFVPGESVLTGHVLNSNVFAKSNFSAGDKYKYSISFQTNLEFIEIDYKVLYDGMMQTMTAKIIMMNF